MICWRDAAEKEEVVKMQNVKRIVCLANSRKLSGRCIAGREWNDGQVGQWVRPVSARENQGLSKNERQYEDGSDPRVLDIIDLPLLDRQPEDCQTENWLLDPESDWRKVGRLASSDLPALTEDAAPLWIDGHSTRRGKNDENPDGESRFGRGLAKTGSRQSLEAQRVHVLRPRAQGRFSHAGIEYALWVTDPEFERRYLAKPDGDYEIGECCLTISLGEPFLGACHKLIAAIITADGR